MSEPASTSIEVDAAVNHPFAPVILGARSRLYWANPLNLSSEISRVNQSLPVSPSSLRHTFAFRLTVVFIREAPSLDESSISLHG
jgi:hypothetical protein